MQSLGTYNAAVFLIIHFLHLETIRLKRNKKTLSIKTSRGVAMIGFLLQQVLVGP